MNDGYIADFRDSAFVYIGGLPFTLSEGDIVTIFSQFGEPVYVNLVRDKETGKSKGFAFLKYEDQRSTDLAVDNLGGATLMGRVLRVDHTNYKVKDDEAITDNTNGVKGDDDVAAQAESEESEEERPLLKEEVELADLMRNHDDDDPMKEYLVQQKKEEVEQALSRNKRMVEKSGSKERHHKHRHSRRHRNEDGDHRRRRSHKEHAEGQSRSRSPPSRNDPRQDKRRQRPPESSREQYRERSRSRERRREPGYVPSERSRR